MKKGSRADQSRDPEIKLPTTRSAYMITDNHAERAEVMVMFRIISRHDWDRLQSWHQSCPGSAVEHLMHGLYVLVVPAGGASLGEAA